MISRIIIIILLSKSFLNGNDNLNPVVKSALIPGWGELSFGEKNRSRGFLILEIGLITSGIGSYLFSKNQVKNYQSFSAEHAGVNIKGKNKKYWVDIGNYNNYEDYNEEHLRFREPEDLYYGTDIWFWDSEENKNFFKSMRINADLLNRQVNFIIGAIFINHIISSIDSLYLYRLKNENKLIIKPRFINRELYLEMKIFF